jgi:hypothetical protein
LPAPGAWFTRAQSDDRSGCSQLAAATLLLIVSLSVFVGSIEVGPGCVGIALMGVLGSIAFAVWVWRNR